MAAKYSDWPGMQHEDGSWHDQGPHDTWPTVSTSFALLFLSKGRVPVLVSKLVHGPGNDWNNDRNDARNLVNYASTELFRGRQMAWQVFDTNRIDIANNEKLLELAGELGKSSVVYFNGLLSRPLFKPMEVHLLKHTSNRAGSCLPRPVAAARSSTRAFATSCVRFFQTIPCGHLPAEHRNLASRMP